MKKFLARIACFLAVIVIAHAQDSGTQIFLKSIPSGFQTVAVKHDEDGNTYILGNRSGAAVITKFDASGSNITGQDVSIANFNAVAFEVVGKGSAGSIYVISSNEARKYNFSGTLQGTYSITTPANAVASDIVYTKATQRVFIAMKSTGSAPVVQVLDPNLSAIRALNLRDLGSTGSTLRSLAVDDSGALYAVGRTGSDAAAVTTGTASITYTATTPNSQLAANSHYLAKINADFGSYTVFKPESFLTLNDVRFSRGWIYMLGLSASDGKMRLERRDSTLASANRSAIFENTRYSETTGASPINLNKFGLSADASDNVYLTGYLPAGTTKFLDGSSLNTEFKSVATTTESAFVAKLNSEFRYQWVKSPIMSPFPTMGNSLDVSWDAKLSRLWWSGSFEGANGLTMQEGSSTTTEKKLPVETTSSQGFVAAFEPNGAFTEVVNFRLTTEYAANRVLLNGQVINNSGSTQSLILNSDINIQSPRIVYQWDSAPVVGGTRPDFETDDIENKAITINNADRRNTFLNFSVNSVVQDSNATVYSFKLTQNTAVQLEWLAEYALTVDSNLDTTVSRATIPPNNTPFVRALSSKASGNPIPAVGKHWIRKDSPVVCEIDGALEDLVAHPGLAIRCVPWRYRVSGAATASAGGNSRTFATVAPRQQIPEFSMSGPASIVYDWKLQYGIDNTASDLAANPELLVEMRAEPPNVTIPQSNKLGNGVSWYDDGTKVLIGAPRGMNLNSGPLDLAGWVNGDNFIFSPSEGNFSPTLADPLSDAQKNAGFMAFTYNGKAYLGREVVLNRPARVVWNYSERIIQKNLSIGRFVEFTDQEVSEFGLIVTSAPTLASSQQGGPTSNDFIWDSVAKKFFPVRPVEMELLWPAINQRTVKVRINPSFNTVNYKHIASTPAVQLVPQPPTGQARDLIYQKVAYTTAGAEVDNDKGFTASGAGWSVIQFSRITPAGRGGTSQSVVELKVVQTKLWNTDAPATLNANIGTKITSALDKAGLGTGYVFFAKARYNPFIYDRTRFAGASIWNKTAPPGPVIPVNQNPTASVANQDLMVVVWYDDPSTNDYLLWPYAAQQYNPQWPTTTPRILISSGYGSESVAANGADQVVVPQFSYKGQTITAATTFDPGRFDQVQIYQQPSRDSAGFNPNEEHALMAPSQRFASVAPRPSAAYALRNNDLNVTTANSTYTSHPYVLVQFLDKTDNEFKMTVLHVQLEDTQKYPNGFTSTVKAGEPVIPFYPLGIVSGAQLPVQNYAKESQTNRLVYWKDHKNTAWAVSGGGEFTGYFYYPLSPDFWWPNNEKEVGTPVAWLPTATSEISKQAFDIDYTRVDQTPLAKGVVYTTTWPLTVPTIKVGETLTFSGGEYASDNPGNPGLPGVLAWASGEVVYDSLNPDMREGTDNPDGHTFDRYTARMISALEQRSVSLPLSKFPTTLLPATGRTRVIGTFYQFEQLSSSLKKRVFFDPLTGRLFIKGLVNDKDASDPTLTAAPPAVYLLEPNILTPTELEELNGTSSNSPFRDLASNKNWTDAVSALYRISRNPNAKTATNENGLTDARVTLAAEYTVGLEVQKKFNANTKVTTSDAERAQSLKAKGPGLALVTNPDYLDPAKTNLPDVSYLTLAENNDPALGGAPVVLHVIKVDRRQRYRGAVKVILSNNVFDENIILRHTGDFGANPQDLVFDWWYRVEDGTTAPTPDAIPAGQTNPWKLYVDPSGNQGARFFQLTLKGNPQAPELLLSDSLWYVRYRHRNEIPSNPISWSRTPAIPYEWAGAGNSRPGDYRPQLAMGWVKRVLDAVNPYEARIRDFTGDSPATYSSMISQFGQRYEGPVALNPDKNVIENVGLIELYSTILHRARSLSIDLSTPVSTPGISNALMLASTRLADFYMLLGNEAYVDAKDSAVGLSTDNLLWGDITPTIFTFQNQVDTQLGEELALLRGVDDYKAKPVYNRLFWNFTKGEGEAAYAMSYNISDLNRDGFIDEKDAMIQYPQGHGDAWGHYLSAIGGQYRLLNNPFFNWVSRSEMYNLMDIVMDVDFLDERKFAQVAAAKAKAGAEIVNLTYRESYVDDPEAQWQGYIDTDRRRAWGVEGWARRAGQGAYFDWITANALIPSVHPNSSYTGIRKVDRTSVKDIAVVSAQMNAIQQTYDDANNGYNPLGISGNTVPFDIDPAMLAENTGVSHFEQMYDRAIHALDNAKFVFSNANRIQNMLRNKDNNEVDFRRSVFEEDMQYRNELIEIFGSPYAGTIGSGKAYPEGYNGPDTSLYMYVDRQSREITARTVPGITAGFMSDVTGIGGKLNELTKEEMRKTYSSSFANGNPADWFKNFGEVNYVTTDANGISFSTAENANRVPLVNMQLPIKSSGYTFEAPATWGQRSAPGELQMQISAMIQQEAELAKAIAAWDAFQGPVVRQLRLIVAQVENDRSIRRALAGKIANNTVLGGTLVGLNSLSNYLAFFAELAPNVAKNLEQFIPKNLPTAGFSFSLGDSLAPLRGVKYTFAQILEGKLKANVVAIKGVIDLMTLTKELIDMGLDYDIDGLERDFGLKQSLVELENMIGDEAILRVEVFRQQESLREMSDRYRATLQRGARLIDEREAYNKRVAELVQRNRYADMSFRVARNAALSRYNEAFNLAARYTYLAAKAYDYETNLPAENPGSARLMLTKIVRERNLGYIWEGGLPAQGYGGLADHLATMKENFNVLKGQLGLNNPQSETGRFSLRGELFRISPDESGNTSWRDTLASKKVANLWDMPEFRRYCRPFAAYDPAVPEPGLVIDFSSMVAAGKNFFGKSLAGGDNAYDPTNFSTKIASVGAWFEGYVSDGFSTGLSQTPRIYLVPVGSDVMTYPSDEKLGVRMWKILDQKVPVPFPITGSNLGDPLWRPLDTLGGTDGELRRFSSFRAYPDSGYFSQGEMTFDTRLIGRSVWNTRWLLIIPGRTLRSDANAGLDTFIENVTDIKLFFQTYGMSGN